MHRPAMAAMATKTVDTTPMAATRPMVTAMHRPRRRTFIWALAATRDTAILTMDAAIAATGMAAEDTGTAVAAVRLRTINRLRRMPAEGAGRLRAVAVDMRRPRRARAAVDGRRRRQPSM